MKRLLVTGGCGFIGSAFLRRYAKERPDTSFINLDLLTYAGHQSNVAAVASLPNYEFVHGDVRDTSLVAGLCARADGVVHFAAETHVDRSLEDASAFVTTNVGGVQALAEGVRAAGIPLVAVSTDEVYGSLGEDDPPTAEDAPLRPGSPYAAAKAGGDLLALAYHRSFGVDVRITRCANNYGPHQYPEKLLPVLIRRALDGESLPLYGDGRNIRDWLFVDDHAAAVALVLERGEAGGVYNIGASEARRNVEMARLVLERLGLPESRLEFVADRPGHDWRYAVDDTRIRTELGWRPETPFASGMEATVDWYLANEGWWRPLLAEAGGRRGLS